MAKQLRIRTMNNLSSRASYSSNYTRNWNTCNSTPGVPGAFYTSGKVIGVTKVTIDEGKTKFDPRVPCFHEFEVRCGTGGYSDGKITVYTRSPYYPQCGYGISQVYTGALTLYLVGSLSYDVSTAISVDSNSADHALTRAWAAVTEPVVDFGENLATIGETIRMIRNPLKGVGNLLRMIHSSSKRKIRRDKRKVPYAKKSSDALASSWLEYRYGIMPLVLDVSKGIQEVEKFTPKMSVVTSHGSKIEPSTRSYSAYDTFLGNLKLSASCDDTTTYVTRACIYHQNIVGMEMHARARSLGLHPSQILQLAWNLIPLSFVVDWFVGVSTWLNGLTPIAEKVYFGNTVSFKTVKRRYMTAVNPIPTQPNMRAEGHAGNATGFTVKYRRIPFWPYPIRMLRGSGLTGNVKREIDALSLIISNFPRIK